MRNDVKLGFAIGGVLLAVLIVYVLVVPGGTSGAKKVGQTTQPSSGTKLASNTASSHRTGSTSDAGKVTLEPVTPAVPPPSTPAVPPPSYTPPTAAATPSSTTPKVDPFAPKSDTAAASDTTPTSVARASTPKNDDWNAILNQPPMLMTTETPTGSAASSSSASSSARGNHTSDSAATLPPAPSGDSTPPISSEPVSSALSSSGSSATSQPSLAGSRTHRIAQGETFASISAAAYGSSKYYPQIMKANPGVDPAHLKVGTTINLPDIGTSSVRPTTPSSAADSSSTGEAQHAAARIAAAPIDTNKQYRVQPGDSLYKISLKLYGKSDRANKIFELNKQSMSDDPHRLKAGQIIELPEPPTQTQTTSSTASR